MEAALITSHTLLASRDVPGKEREKRERERNWKGTRSFLSRSSVFDDLFPRFWRKSSRTGEKRAGTAKKMVERCGTAKNSRSTPFQIVEFGEIPFFCRLKPVFAPVPTHYLPRSKPVLDPIPNPFLPFSTPILVPFLYYLAIISRCAPVAAQPLDHVGPSLVRGISGRFVFMARRH